MARKRRNFRPARDVQWAKFCTNPPAFVHPQRRSSGARRRGELYDAAVQERLEAIYGDAMLHSPWVRFADSDDTRPRFCQPDALHFDVNEGIVTVVEIKLRHCELAWMQLKWLYLPVVQAIFPPDLWRYRTVEVARFVDPHEHTSERPVRVRRLDEAHPGEFAVWSLKTPRI